MKINQRSSGAIIHCVIFPLDEAIHAWIAGCKYTILAIWRLAISGHAFHAAGMTLYLNEMKIGARALRHFIN